MISIMLFSFNNPAQQHVLLSDFGLEALSYTLRITAYLYMSLYFLSLMKQLVALSSITNELHMHIYI